MSKTDLGMLATRVDETHWRYRQQLEDGEWELDDAQRENRWHDRLMDQSYSLLGSKEPPHPLTELRIRLQVMWYLFRYRKYSPS